MSLTNSEHLEYIKCSERPKYFIDTYINMNWKGEPTSLTVKQADIVDDILANRNSFIEDVERGTGVTTVICAYILWYITFNSDKIVLLSSHNSSATRLISHLLLTLSDRLPHYLQQGVVNRSPHRIIFKNGTKVFTSTPTENTTRGMHVDLIYVDNYRRIRDEQFTAFYEVATATPYTKMICSQTG